MFISEQSKSGLYKVSGVCAPSDHVCTIRRSVGSSCDDYFLIQTTNFSIIDDDP